MPERRHEAAVERSDIRLRPVLATGGVLLLIVVAVTATVGGLLRGWGLPADAGTNAPLDFRPAGAALQPAPQDERAAYDAEQESRLRGYGWVDRQAGIARIPVDLAMTLLASGAARDGGAPAAAPARRRGR